MKAMKKTIAVLLTLCMVFSMLAVAAVSVSAEETEQEEQPTRTITACVISYLITDLGATGWQVHYWSGTAVSDSDLVATGETIQRKLGNDYWNDEEQSFTIFTAEIPADATGFKVHNGDRWFGEDGSLDKPVAFVFNYHYSDNALYWGGLTTGYFLVGSFNNWQMTDAYQINQEEYYPRRIEDVEIKKNEEFKVRYYDYATDSSAWYPEGDNIKAQADGKYTVTVNPDPDDPTKFTADYSALSGSSLTLADGDIGLNLYFDMSSETMALPVDFFWSGMSEQYESKDLTYDDNLHLYKATVNVPAPEMVCKIGFSYPLDRNQDYREGETSVGELALEYRNYPETYGQNESDLAGAMLNYGAQTQLQFKFKDTELVVPDTINPKEANEVLFYGDTNPANVIIPNIAADSLNAYNMQYAGCSLLLQTKTTMRFYFKKLSGYQDAPTVTFGGAELDVNPVENSSSYVYVDVKGINACELGDAKVLKVGDVELGTFSALSYVKLALTREDTSNQLKKTVTALYSYYWYAYKAFHTDAA